MRIVAFAGLLAFTAIAISSAPVSAEALDLLQVNKPGATFAQTSILASFEPEPVAESAPPIQAEPLIAKYIVVENDSLNKIAEAHKTTWKRLFDKNESIQNPDIITVGTELVIPNADEALKERPLPQPEPTPAPAASQPAAQPPVQNKRTIRRPTTVTTRAVVQTRGSSSGNTYSPGYCTWYVKNKRPNLPNNLGNANTWVSRASAQGMATGSTPIAGAVGQRGMHVVYVESVNGDGTVNISEMNHKGLYVITHRTLPASYFTYIY